MPIEHRIDAGRKLVLATPRGTMTLDDILAYQRDVWSRPELRGYAELVDMRAVEHIAEATAENVQQVTRIAAPSDPPSGPPARMAIVSTDDLAYGLGRMYGSLRDRVPGSNKHVQVFRDFDEALAWVTGGD